MKEKAWSLGWRGVWAGMEEAGQAQALKPEDEVPGQREGAEGPSLNRERSPLPGQVADP